MFRLITYNTVAFFQTRCIMPLCEDDHYGGPYFCGSRALRRRRFVVISIGAACQHTEGAESQGTKSTKNRDAEIVEEMRNGEGCPLPSQIGDLLQAAVAWSKAATHLGEFFAAKKCLMVAANFIVLVYEIVIN